MTIKVYTAEGCSPCQAVKAGLSKQGYKIDGQRVEVVDVSTDAGFDDFVKSVLAHGDGAVPSAFKDGQQCEILLDDETGEVFLECPHSEDQ